MSAEAATPAWLRPHVNGCTLTVRIQPGAKKTAIVGHYGEGEEAALKIAVQAPPIDGRANDALIAYLADALELARSQVTLLSGATARSKVLLLTGISVTQAASYLAGTL